MPTLTRVDLRVNVSARFNATYSSSHIAAAIYRSHLTRVDLRVNVSARFNAAGDCTEVVCVGQDVTATNAARGRQAELEQQIAELGGN